MTFIDTFIPAVGYSDVTFFCLKSSYSEDPISYWVLYKSVLYAVIVTQVQILAVTNLLPISVMYFVLEDGN
jgi:hypothetical protein